LRALGQRYGVNPKTIGKWKGRASVADLRTGPKEPRSTVLSVEEEAVEGDDEMASQSNAALEAFKRRRSILRL
jgi:transposase-like protein